MNDLIKILDNAISEASKADDRNAVISEAFKEIRDKYGFNKLDLRDVVTLDKELEFIYRMEFEGVKIYITGTALKVPRVWIKLSYIIL